MKQTIFSMLVGIVLLATGCSGNTYSYLRDKEDKLIANYISRNNLVILKEEPDMNHVWAEKEYYKMVGVDNFYFHLNHRGDSIRVDASTNDTIDLSIDANDIIVARYKRFELIEDADTLSYWSTLDQAYPMEFHYLNLSECEATAWHLAVQLMKYPDSECEIIVPSKLGFSDAQTTVTPYVYIMKIKVKP